MCILLETLILKCNKCNITSSSVQGVKSYTCFILVQKTVLIRNLLDMFRIYIIRYLYGYSNIKDVYEQGDLFNILYHILLNNHIIVVYRYLLGGY